MDNGDGTVTDNQTGLMWEKKTGFVGTLNLADAHDVNNGYTWSASGTSPDGTLYTEFLATLNLNSVGNYPNGAPYFCFVNHCDWRIPTVTELQSIIKTSAAGCGSGSPCIDVAFGPTQILGTNAYWSSTSLGAIPGDAMFVAFSQQSFSQNTFYLGKGLSTQVRAVRGGH